MGSGIEYDVIFDNSQDAMDRLQAKYDRLVVRYLSMYDALQEHLKDDKDRKAYLIDKYQKDNNDITTKIEGLKQTKLRDLNTNKLEE